MTQTLLARRCFLVALVGANFLSGCSRVPPSSVNEENNSYFVLGQQRAKRGDFEGAGQAFEKALEENPASGAAHFELGLIDYKNMSNWAGAIYHFEKYLQLRPKAAHADTVKGFVLDCKQELAKGVSLAAVSQKMQKEMESLTRENQKLQEQVELLEHSLAVATNTPPQVQFVYTNNAFASFAPPSVKPPAETSSKPRSTPRPPPSSAALGSSVPLSSAISSSRTHTVKTGETPYSIARRYGLKVNSLLAANPNLDPKRLRAGQILQIPPK
jgi:LysM repeat protein